MSSRTTDIPRQISRHFPSAGKEHINSGSKVNIRTTFFKTFLNFLLLVFRNSTKSLYDKIMRKLKFCHKVFFAYED